MKRRILCLLLLMCMLVPSIVACKTNPNENISESVGSSSGDVSGESTNKYDVYDDLGDIDLEGRTITIASSDYPWYGDEIAVGADCFFEPFDLLSDHFFHHR